MRQHNCILGCPEREGQTIHCFPKNPERRAQWLELLGMETILKNIYLCSDHFSEGQLFGKRVHMFAVPDRNLPPKFKYLENPPYSESLEIPSSNTELRVQQSKQSHILSNDIYPVTLNTSILSVSNEISTNCITNKQINTSLETVKSKLHEIADPLYIKSLDVGEVVVSSDEEIADDKVVEKPCTKSEDFEIRHRSSYDIILKGRYVQSEDNSIISYTIPNGFSLAEQVDNLLVKSETQKKELKILKTKRLILSKQLKKHKDIFLKMKKNLAKRKEIKVNKRNRTKAMIQFCKKR